jgi:hypothetical protein
MCRSIVRDELREQRHEADGCGDESTAQLLAHACALTSSAQTSPTISSLPETRSQPWQDWTARSRAPAVLHLSSWGDIRTQAPTTTATLRAPVSLISARRTDLVLVLVVQGGARR